MIKGLHFFKMLSIILSVTICNSKTSFGQELKKDLGVCGQTLSSIMKFDQNGEPVLESSMFVKESEEFCDDGRYELNANYKIYLYDEKNDLIYDKYVFLNPVTTVETMDKKKKNKFKMVKMIPNSTSRIVKFPIIKTIKSITSYKIEEIKIKKISQIKKMEWINK